jgi:hypothetical protein
MSDQLLSQLVNVGSEIGPIHESLTSFYCFGQFVPKYVLLHYVGHRYTSLDFECLSLFSFELDNCLFKVSFEVICPHLLFLQILELVSALNPKACLSLPIRYLRCHYQTECFLENSSVFIALFTCLLHTLFNNCTSFRHHKNLGGTEGVVFLTTALHAFSDDITGKLLEVLRFLIHLVVTLLSISGRQQLILTVKLLELLSEREILLFQRY